MKNARAGISDNPEDSMQIFNGFVTKDKMNKTARMRSYFGNRMPGGKIYNMLAKDISAKSGSGRLMFDLFVYFAGSRLPTFLFPKMRIEKTGKYTAGGFLYHLTPAENIEEIRQNGLVSKRNYVFLTDDADCFVNGNNYLNWKATALKKNTEFRVIKIDASALGKRRRIFCTDREHEFVTDKVEPGFILFD